MERKIKWSTGCFDDIGLVYERAEKDKSAAAMLSELETMALSEAENNCGMLKYGDKPLTREKFLSLDEYDKELGIFILAGMGLEGFDPSMDEIPGPERVWSFAFGRQKRPHEMRDAHYDAVSLAVRE